MRFKIVIAASHVEDYTLEIGDRQLPPGSGPGHFILGQA